MKTLSVLAALTVLMLLLVACEDPTASDANDSNDTDVSDGYDFEPDPNDTDALAVLDVIPEDGTAAVNPSVPVIIYFNDIVDPSTVSSSTIPIGTGTAGTSSLAASTITPLAGTYSLAKSADGSAAILTFAPDGGFPEGSTIGVSISGSAVLDDGGNEIGVDANFSFVTSTQITTTSSALGFEAGTSGLAFVGNGGIVSLPAWGLSAIEGSNAAVLTTGTIVAPGLTGSAIEEQYSVMSTGLLDVPAGATEITISYYFVSDEFLEFLDSEFDDNATLTVAGNSGARTVTLASVNQFTAADLNELTEFPEDDMEGAADYYTTDLLNKTVSLEDLGSTVSLAISISDVADEVVTSALVFDAIDFQ